MSLISKRRFQGAGNRNFVEAFVKTDRGLAVWYLWAKYTTTFLLERFRKWYRLQVDKLDR